MRHLSSRPFPVFELNGVGVAFCSAYATNERAIHPVHPFSFLIWMRRGGGKGSNAPGPPGRFFFRQVVRLLVVCFFSPT